MSLAQGETHLKMREPPRTGSSLNDLIIQNPWLSVHPLCWTAQHLQLLGCEFHDINVPPEAETETETEIAAPDADAMGYATEKLATHPNTVKRHQAARALLCRKGSPLEPGWYVIPTRINLNFADAIQTHSEMPTFVFAGFDVHIPQCTIYLPATTANAPTADDGASPLIVGYYRYDTVTGEREDRFNAGSVPDGGWNFPVDRILQKKLAKCTPEVWTRDPYLPANYHVRLLVSKEADTTDAHVFDAEFSASVLKQLDEPSHHEKATWPTIYHTRVPYQPYATFANRITSHLVRNKHSLRIKEAGTGPQCIPMKRKFGQELQV
ncbi:hypothetical protein FAUST_1440 [Fusarium austroamericanum]|uniref:Uncharacterized protein n=1 Tax=Fusarium austroamericanum TaxID=282268 RepID=A0AAN6HJQ6_FUSAU|nr:hypothetical protein FAUST_1440 [Fusarium austroamericanum]